MLGFQIRWVRLKSKDCTAKNWIQNGKISGKNERLGRAYLTSRYRRLSTYKEEKPNTNKKNQGPQLRS